jgi:hypothetical protein
MSTDNTPSEQPRGFWSRIGTPGKWSIGLGVVLPVVGWLSRGDFTAEGMVGMFIVIPLWAAALRLLIYLGQRLFSR